MKTGDHVHIDGYEGVGEIIAIKGNNAEVAMGILKMKVKLEQLSPAGDDEWEEDEEKETKDKANNVWDAINEIPDLDDDLRYEAMTLVHSLGMKSGFVKMSVADRRGWIKQNLRKQS